MMTKDGRAFPFRIEMRGDIAILHCEATHYHADSFTALGAALAEASDAAVAGNLVIDLSAVMLFSSTALRALRAAHLAMEARGGRIVAVGGGELVAGVLKFAPFITHAPTFDDAVAAFGAARREGKGSR